MREGYWYTVGPNSIIVVLYKRKSEQYDILRRKKIAKRGAIHRWYRPGSQETTFILMSNQLQSSSLMF